VSVHIGSQIRSAARWRAMERVHKLVLQLRSDGITLKAIDAGGGLGIDYHGGIFDAAGRVAEYTGAIDAALRGFAGRLLLEPGRFIVAQAGALVAKVLQVKRNGKKTFVITDAAMNDLIRPALYQAFHEIVPVRPRRGRPRAVDIVGPVCETGDFFARDRNLSPVEPGTWWRCSMPARTAWRKAPTTIPPSPRRGSGGGAKARLIRRRETIGDLLAPEMV